MNIFVYDPDPHTCALWVDDVRKNKLITEHGQMLTAALDYRKPVWFSKRSGRINYPVSVMSHPCTRWVRESWANFRWLVTLNQYYIDMWPGHHASNRIMSAAYEAGDTFGMNDSLTPFANCARSRSHNLDFTNVDDVHQAYRQYHVARWAMDNPPPTWKHGRAPSWRGGGNASS